MDLASAAKADGHTVTILIGGNGIFYKKLRNHGLNVRRMRFMIRSINPFQDLLSFFECLDQIKKIKPDIIHLHSTKAGVLGRLASAITKVPSVYTAHGWAFTDGVSIFRRNLAILIEKFVSKFCCYVICVSDYDLRLAKVVRAVSAKKLVLIHNGVPDLKNALQIENKKEGVTKLVIVARLDAPKLHEMLFFALSNVNNATWSLDVVGDGPNRDALSQLATQLGLTEKINFWGSCEDVSSRLCVADVFILVSAWEGLPLSIIEAMRAGLPVIASDVGGVSELIQDGKNGYLIPRNDENCLTEKIEFLLKNKTVRQDMGRIGREKYENEFSFDLMYKKTINVYELAIFHEK